MKKLLIIFLIIILTLVFANYNNNPQVIVSRLFDKKDIQPNELKYKFYLLGVLPVGEAIFIPEKIEEYKGQKVYHLRATGETLKLYSALFKGSVIFDSYIDMLQLNPIVFKQKILVTNKPTINKEILYEQEKGIMHIGDEIRNILPNTQDPLSAIFNIGRMDFGKIKKIEMNFNTNQKNYILEGTALPKNISIGRKIYKTYILQAEISRRDKNPYHKSKITIALLKQDTNIPILIKVFSSGFLINARLIEIK